MCEIDKVRLGEVVKHPQVASVYMCEIDEVRISRKYIVNWCIFKVEACPSKALSSAELQISIGKMS